MNNEQNETPCIELEQMNTVDGKNVIFYICRQRGEWTEPFCREGVTIMPPVSCPTFTAIGKQLCPRGCMDDQNNAPMIATVADYSRIRAAVTAFNAHFAARAEAEKAEEPEPRRIVDSFDLGISTTSTECRDCKGHDGHFDGTPRCKRYDKALVCTPHARSGALDTMRCAQCLAAEERYKAMRAMMEACNDD